MSLKNKGVSRRQFLKYTGGAAALAAASALPFRLTTAQGSYTPPPSDISAQLSIFNFGGEAVQSVYGEAIARFNQRYPNVTVEDNYNPIPNGDWAQYINQYRTRVASGLAPDILAMAIEGTRLAITDGLLVQVDDYIANDPDGEAFISGIHPTLHDALKYEGQTYFITREWNNMIIHYNVRMFEEAGLDLPASDWTWDDFLEASLALTTGEGGDKIFGFGIPFFNFALQPWFHTNGTSQLTEDWSDSNLDDPKVLEAVKFVHSLVHEHGVSPAPEGTDQYNLFASERVAMTAAGHWTIGQWAEANLPMDVQNWPRKEAATTVFGSGGWAIGAGSQNPDLAWELIKDLGSLETDRGIARIGAAIPAREEATEVEEYQAYPPSSELFFGSLEDIKPVPAPANFTEVQTIFMRHMTSIMSNAVTPEQGLEAAHIELSDAMARLREG